VAISERTLGYLIEMVGDLGHSALTSFLMRAGISEGDPGVNATSRVNRASAAINAARRRGDEAGLVECSRSILNFGSGKDPKERNVAGLVRALRADGWLAEATDDEPRDYWSGRPPYRWTVQPLGTAELPLPPQMNSAEEELRAHGLDVAASHLGQAYRAFIAGDLEASNSQLRPAFEATVVTIAQMNAAWSGNAGGSAIQAIQTAGLFEKGEFDLVIGLWRLSHTNGSHPGLTSDAEALFRLSSVTALLRYLVARFL
jgi:hypothetical protein